MLAKALAAILNAESTTTVRFLLGDTTIIARNFTVGAVETNPYSFTPDTLTLHNDRLTLDDLEKIADQLHDYVTRQRRAAVADLGEGIGQLDDEFDATCRPGHHEHETQEPVRTFEDEFNESMSEEVKPAIAELENMAKKLQNWADQPFSLVLKDDGTKEDRLKSWFEYYKNLPLDKVIAKPGKITVLPASNSIEPESLSDDDKAELWDFIHNTVEFGEATLEQDIVEIAQHPMLQQQVKYEILQAQKTKEQQ